MAKNIKTDGLDAYIDLLSSLSNQTEINNMCKGAIYDGADIVADTIRQEIKSSGGGKDPKHGMTDKDKEDLLEGLGISKMEATAQDVNVKVGFNGYSSKNTWRDSRTGKVGKRPISMVARTVLKGTSWHARDNFIGRAVRKAQDKSIKAMDDALQKSFEMKFKG